AYARLDAAFSHSGRIAWNPDPTLSSESIEHQGPTEEPVSRWISVVFLQGEEADDVLELIDRDGQDAGIEHLTGFDYGDETTDAALENGYVYDEPPTGPLDRVVTEGDYTLTYNPAMGHVSLLRAHTVPPDPALDDSDVVPTREAIAGSGALDPSAPATTPGAAPAPAMAETGWFAGPAPRPSCPPRPGAARPGRGADARGHRRYRCPRPERARHDSGRGASAGDGRDGLVRRPGPVDHICGAGAVPVTGQEPERLHTA